MWLEQKQFHFPLMRFPGKATLGFPGLSSCSVSNCGQGRCRTGNPSAGQLLLPSRACSPELQSKHWNLAHLSGSQQKSPLVGAPVLGALSAPAARQSWSLSGDSEIMEGNHSGRKDHRIKLPCSRYSKSLCKQRNISLPLKNNIK